MKHHVARDISYAGSDTALSGRALIRSMESATAGRSTWWCALNFPEDGPLTVVANHPYGILDGLMIGHILSAAGCDFRILSHRVFRRAEVLNRVVLQTVLDEKKDAQQQNIATRKEALASRRMAPSASPRAAPSRPHRSCLSAPTESSGAASPQR